jgi:two-component system, NtrC family, sensor kinase
MGLGLALAYQVVELTHAGALSCQSEVQQGSQFILEIPIHPPQTHSCSLMRE